MNQFSRFIKMIGNDKFEIIRQKKVLVVGVGGVGGYVVEGLVRAGINNIVVLDHDVVDITNLNRQIIATQNNIGKLKAEAIKERVLAINPDCQINTFAEFLDESNISHFITPEIDYVIDACDTVKTKQILIKKCLENKIKFISCMGTGNKFRPELLTITDLKNTSYDKLAKVMRKWMQDEHITAKIPVVSSTEPCIKPSDQIIGSTSFVPSVAGMLCVSFVINDIIKSN